MGSTRNTTAGITQSIRDAIYPEAAAQRNKAELLEQLRKSRRSDDVVWLMSSERGRRIVYQLLADCGYQGTTIAADGLPSAVLEGRRTVAIALAGELAIAHPEEWVLMLREKLTDVIRA